MKTLLKTLSILSLLLFAAPTLILAQTNIIDDVTIPVAVCSGFAGRVAVTYTIDGIDNFLVVTSSSLTGTGSNVGLAGAGTHTTQYQYIPTLGAPLPSGSIVTLTIVLSNVAETIVYASTTVDFVCDTGVIIRPTVPPLALTVELPPIPVCAAQSAVNGSVRASLSAAQSDLIHCRQIVNNGQTIEAGAVGIAGLDQFGIVQAVDIFSPAGLTYFEGGGVFCLQGSGTLIWLAASGVPRHPEIIGSYTVPEFTNFTCATLFEPGTLVLVSDNPLD
ncbi:MAG: hypothetical protein IPO91_29615 [Chloroflexi bacterium]|nr:hypothetical protein [Chloroflexota bacterium]